ncbi:hypothetical protein [Meiothermus phage MMP17]|nr:hypothetical protein [Meiothermus phage MMP17]
MQAALGQPGHRGHRRRLPLLGALRRSVDHQGEGSRPTPAGPGHGRRDCVERGRPGGGRGARRRRLHPAAQAAHSRCPGLRSHPHEHHRDRHYYPARRLPNPHAGRGNRSPQRPAAQPAHRGDAVPLGPHRGLVRGLRHQRQPNSPQLRYHSNYCPGSCFESQPDLPGGINAGY